ncbi:DUF6958 family protein [Jannaschia sp. W003]|uniref:DUF6958 family protein n=1 Tax=Jannaschia sp. W003 TaxID=2867012 RepID=UPI0021A51275|nr:hypothetical protein [Jannaschia sp. W003]UWQ22333.1 hypothetical protein K3554_04670 [Jannaschia sp. W003]
MTGERVLCRTPNNPGTTRIPAWKFEACRAAILAELADGERGAMALADAAAARLSASDRAAMGSVGWHMTTVRLELEVRGEVARSGRAPVRLALP